MTDDRLDDHCDQDWSHAPAVQPDAARWKTVRLPKPRDFQVAAPPANCSPETLAELAELKEYARLLTEADMSQIWRWSTNEESPLVHWAEVLDECCRRYKLSPPAGARLHAALAESVYRSFIACWQQKWRYLRPRPTDLDPTLPTAIPVPRHPSYPSGHSTVAAAAAAVLTQFFPDEAARWKGMAEEAGIARLKAGIHYRSDHTAGLALGTEIATGILTALAKDGGPKEYRL
ncbi:MAG TPA: vanadium-dependent haloperoxidase [Symbiobacteriaceae bacterium]|nr:vanadium-dependent haloperoxidase [Symbiobacteriaceae bacterium]